MLFQVFPSTRSWIYSGVTKEELP